MTTKSARLEARLSHRYQTLIEHAAALRGQSMTDFVVAASLAEARKVITENDIIEISAADQKRFVEALLKPKAPTTVMKIAAQAHRQLIEPS